MRQLILLSLAGSLLLAGPILRADVLKPYKVTFRTTDCAGDTGLASVDVDRIEKIRSLECNPGASGRRIKQVLTKSASGASGYEVHTVTADEADKIEKQINAYMDARKKAVEGGKTIIIDH